MKLYIYRLLGTCFSGECNEHVILIYVPVTQFALMLDHCIMLQLATGRHSGFGTAKKYGHSFWRETLTKVFV